MAKDVLTCMNCGNIIGSERLKYAKCFCSDLCLTEFWDEGKKKKDAKIMAKCCNCNRHFLPHEPLFHRNFGSVDYQINFCSSGCKATFSDCYFNNIEHIDNVNKSMNSSTVIGNNNHIRGHHILIIGNNNKVSGDFIYFCGDNNNAYGGNVRVLSGTNNKRSAQNENKSHPWPWIDTISEEYMKKTYQPTVTECLTPLTISDLFSLDNEEEFTQYLNDIIAEKTK